MSPLAPITSGPAATVNAPAKPAAPDPALLKAAKDFESIFVRQMLKSVEKTTAAGCGAKAAPGQGTYGSMIVDTLSESISRGGGLGLADVIAKSMIASHPGLGSGPSAEKLPPGAEPRPVPAPKPL